jgi:glycosyltransferase involved in cell wall biosynthesis
VCDEPLVSVIIPAYNSAQWLPQTLASVFGQSHKSLEVIVVDDGSSDSSAQVARECGARVIEQENSGASIARNRGLQAASGDYLQFLDADDLLSPEKIAGQLDVLRATDGTWIAACPFLYFFDGQDPERSTSLEGDWLSAQFTPGQWFSKLLGLNGEPWRIVANGCYLVPRRIALAAGPWMPERSPDDDGEYFLRVVLNSSGVISTGGRFFYRKFHASRSFSGYVNERWCSGVYASITRKYETLRRWDPAQAEAFAAREFGSLACIAYPDYPEIYRQSLQRTLAYGGIPLPKFSTSKGRLLSRLLGWKAARRLQSLQKRVRDS